MKLITELRNTSHAGVLARSQTEKGLYSPLSKKHDVVKICQQAVDHLWKALRAQTNRRDYGKFRIG